VASSRVKNADIRVFPEWPSGATVPVAEDYELPESAWQPALCLARVFDPNPDKRWSTAIYRQGQCCKPVAADGLCEVCARRKFLYQGGPGQWLGRLDEAAPSWAHVMDNDWFFGKQAEGKLFFNLGAPPPGGGAGSEPAASVASSTSSEVMREAREAAALKRQQEQLKKREELEAAKLKKELDKLAEKERKEADRLAEKAFKEAARLAEKQQKEAEKAERVRALAAAKAVKTVKPSAVPVAAVPAAPAVPAVPAVPVGAKPSPAPEPVKAELRVVMINGDAFAVIGKKVHGFDADTETVEHEIGVLGGSGTEDDPYSIEAEDDAESA